MVFQHLGHEGVPVGSRCPVMGAVEALTPSFEGNGGRLVNNPALKGGALWLSF